MSSRRIMVIRRGAYTFEKGVESPTINVYLHGQEVDILTHYGVRRSWNKFEEVTDRYEKEMASPE